MKNIYLLGATGSIGSQVIEIIEDNSDDFNLVAISGFNNLEKIIEIGSRFSLELIAVKDESDASVLKNIFSDVKIVYGEAGLVELSCYNEEDQNGILINALVGMVGLKPTIGAIKINRDILLANKESLVVGGHLIKELLIEHPINLFPIDSEHSALWQILNGEKKEEIKRIIITASGGSFRDLSKEELSKVTLKDALNHPNWSMGKKITVDSATLMNKGFEIIEAAYLFDLDIDKITSVIHRESIIHSMIEFVDNSVISQLANPDMRLPISYAMYYPKRVNNKVKSLDFNNLKKLSFEEIDNIKFPLLGLAIECYKQGGSARTVLNAANEAAVSLFIREKIKFTDIEKIIFESVKNHNFIDNPSLDEIYEIDKEIKSQIFTKYDE